jgi:hypothetical protein
MLPGKSETESKRPYHKPVVQVYGTLKQLTQATSAPFKNELDNPGNFKSGDFPSNRT